MRPLGAPGHAVVPDSVVPCAPVGDVSVQEQIDRLHDMPPDLLLKDLEQAFRPPAAHWRAAADRSDRWLPAHWRLAADRPDRWLRGYAGALADVWAVAEPLWSRARPLLDREVARVGVASVRGGADALLGSLAGRLVRDENGLVIEGVAAGVHELGDRSLVLVPMLAGKDALIVGLDDPEAVWIAYPVPAAGRLWRTDTDDLSELVGPVRAELLRTLDRPMTMTALAGGMNIPPSSLTFHCDRLVAARLIARERRGREVWIDRTPRAGALLELCLR
ncbi:ArsR/SmtB family transcription factor [Nonomuraea angiospora]|uniref:DNA-binding transcriptional ArsR family regulator n=1 Tax=Nonomuraea angiospora TaxID=46172 RepID=A0ABR9MG38_9ACTN|nr:helix-turn-helix domain-containing protein [Nonomuraea angiospora]MBE1591875.1 DNA-binding transcriptional ArsR family regulator [Nonomuraea angiospora]